MSKDDLSPRETEIVELSAEGMTNEGIATSLGISIGTVNTYWLRIKFKAGGMGRTDIVHRIYKRRFELALQEQRIDWEGLKAILEKRQIFDSVVEKARGVELRTQLAMLELVMDFNETSAWTTDDNLSVHMLTNVELPSRRAGLKWQNGKTLYEVFNTDDKAHPAISAHLAALAGSPKELELGGEFANMRLKVVPVLDEESDDVICCISILMSSSSNQ